VWRRLGLSNGLGHSGMAEARLMIGSRRTRRRMGGRSREARRRLLVAAVAAVAEVAAVAAATSRRQLQWVREEEEWEVDGVVPGAEEEE
jgi:hypothetical protein